MNKIIRESNIAIVGGGKVCKEILKIIFGEDFSDQRPKIIGVADIDDQAEGLRYARDMGIFTTSDYQQFYAFENLDLIIELTKDDRLREKIKRTKPPKVRLIDHYEAMSVWDFLQIEERSIRTRRELQKNGHGREKIQKLFDQFSDHLARIVADRTTHLQNVEKELVESERTMSQIIQGSTIPTFVINKDHIVTHWNKACEKLTGFSADEIVGTNKQWVPFRSEARPIMGDVIVEQMKEEEIIRYYGAKWHKSALIEGAYEGEEYFPNLGENGKWLLFTAAPLKSPGGEVIGAIETLWDKTEDKKAEEEKARHTRELYALVSIYMALSTSLDLENKIHVAAQEIGNYLSADSICIFLKQAEGNYRHAYCNGSLQHKLHKNKGEEIDSLIDSVARSGEISFFEDIPTNGHDDTGFLAGVGLKSLAYIPMTAKEKKVFGVIRVGSKRTQHFTVEEKNILELIGNRIGVAIENAILHEQYKKSEEKYRSLFNNDPNPIFIIDSKTFKILDVNQRAQDCYGYSRDELFGMPFLSIGDKDDEELAEGLKNISKGESILFSKKRHYRKGHEPFFVNVNVSYAKYSERDVLIASTTDITESVEKETQLIQASKMTTLGVMTAGMAHEINQPLNVIQVCADFFLKMVKKGMPISDEDLKSMANDISANVQRAAGIIKHMRDFARQSEVVRTKVNINDPIKDVFSVLGHQLKVHQIELELNLDPDLPYIMAEHNRMEQVFINLVTNAVDAMDEKGKKMGTQEWRRLLKIKSFSENNQVVVTVSDTGTGMPQGIIDKIFEPFFTTKDVGKGTGLGVSISYGIVKDYDGTIKIESEVGKGTTFELRFPVSI
jgi:PAS domain S-box-containing protein